MTDGIQIERSRHAQEFVIIGNADARNPRLSFRARGLHHHLLSLPPGWRVTTIQLAKEHPEGRDAIRTALNELVSLGYVTMDKHQDGHGHWHTTMTVHDKPQPETDAQSAGPGTEDGFPGVGNPGVGEPGAKELNTVTENGEDQKMAPRRAAHSVHGDETDTRMILDEVKRAARRAYGEAEDLTDEEGWFLYRRFCCRKDGTPRELDVSVYAYLTGGPLRCVPTLEQALEAPSDRGIPMADTLRFNDRDTADEDRIAIVEDNTGDFGPGEEPAVEKMIMDGRPLHYIVNAVCHGQLHVAA